MRTPVGSTNSNGTHVDIKAGQQAERLSIRLDIYRAIAALIVVLGHVRALFFIRYSEIPHPSLSTSVFYTATALGHQAVMVFFVLSGFLVGGSAFRLIKQQKWSWSEYLRRRLTRLYVVLLPALVLTWLWDQLGIHQFGVSVYGGLPSDNSILPHAVASVSTWQIMLGNLFFVQDIYVLPFGSNVPLWSLSYEFWYYMLFPCVLIALTTQYGSSKRRFYALAMVAFCVVLGWKVVIYFFVWALGVAVAVLGGKSSYRFASWAAWLAYASFAATVVVARFKLAQWEFLGDGLVAVAFAFLLLTVVVISRDATGLPSRSTASGRVVRALAGFSYTLYLTHAPLLVYFHVLLFSLTKHLWYPDLTHFVFGLAIVAGTLAYAWIISLGTERRTDTFRARLSRTQMRAYRKSPPRAASV